MAEFKTEKEADDFQTDLIKSGKATVASCVFNHASEMWVVKATLNGNWVDV